MDIIQRDALHAFVDRQLFRIESTPPPPDLRALERKAGLTVEEVRAVWIGAGIASQIGMALALDPSRFVTGWPVAADDGAEAA